MEEGGGSFLDIVFTGCYNDGVDEFGHEKRNERAFQYWVVLISILETKSVILFQGRIFVRLVFLSAVS